MWLVSRSVNVGIEGETTSRNLARGRERLSGPFANEVEVLAMLDDPKRYTHGACLYCVMNTGDLTEALSRRVSEDNRTWCGPVIFQRWQDRTGSTATHAQTGESFGNQQTRS